MRYYAVFVPGVQAYIAELIGERFPGAVILKLLDGAVLFDAPCTYDRLNFHCFNNIFAVISIMEHLEHSAGGTGGRFSPLEEHLRKAAVSGASQVISENNGKIRSFRVFCSMENRPAGADEKVRLETEKFIARESGLVVNRARPDTEFWFLYRREGFSLFMKRLSRHAPFEKTLHPGELTPQLAWLLCSFSNPKHTDLVVDPFCGYGSIPEQRTKHFPFKKMYALDIDAGSVSVTKNKLKGRQAEKCKTIKSGIHDIFNVLSPGEADAIITDPPWGLYRETSVPPQKFYDEMTVIFSRLLKEGGRAVVLTAKKEELELSARKVPELNLVKTYHVLVSGKKAAVYVMEKTARDGPAVNP